MERQELHFVNFVNPEEDSKRRENRKLVRTLAMKDAVQKRNRLAAKEKASKSPISDQQAQSPTVSEGSKSEAKSPKDEKGEKGEKGRTARNTPASRVPGIKRKNPKRTTSEVIGTGSVPAGSTVKGKAPEGTRALSATEARRRSIITIAKPGSCSKRTSDALSPSPGPSSKAPRISSPREISRKGTTLDPFGTIAINPSFEELAICGIFLKGMSGISKIWYSNQHQQSDDIPKQLIPLILTDPALYHAHMFATMSAWIGLAEPNPQLSSGPLNHEIEAIRHISKAITSTFVSDEIMLAVALLATEEIFYRNFSNGLEHAKGLIRMLEMQGGLDSIKNPHAKFFLSRLSESGLFDFVKGFDDKRKVDKYRAQNLLSEDDFRNKLVISAANPERRLPPWGRMMPSSLQDNYKKLLKISKEANALSDPNSSLEEFRYQDQLQEISTSLQTLTAEEKRAAGSLENDIIRMTLLIICWKLQNNKSPADCYEIAQELEKSIRISLDYMTVEHMRLLLWCCYVGGAITTGATRKWYADIVHLIGGQAGYSWQFTKRLLRDFIWIDRSQNEWKRLWQESRRYS